MPMGVYTAHGEDVWCANEAASSSTRHLTSRSNRRGAVNIILVVQIPTTYLLALQPPLLERGTGMPARRI